MNEIVDSIRTAITSDRDTIFAELSECVSFASVHGENMPECAAVTQWTERSIQSLQLPGEPEVQCLTTSDGSTTVLAHSPAAAGKPTVLLYSHNDVQPAGDLSLWDSPPWTLTERDGRWYGRGSADCKGNLVMHLACLRALAATAPPHPERYTAASNNNWLGGVGVTLVVEGSEETGGGGLDDLIRQQPELFTADTVVIADAGNVAPAVPTLTTSLRGIANVEVRVNTLESGAHSGLFGGPAPDALAALITILSTLKDPVTGAVTIPGIDTTQRWEGMHVSPEQFAQAAGVLPGVDVMSHAPAADMMWAQPALTVVGMDCPAVDGAIAAVPASARALINLRVPPGMDPQQSQEMLCEHIRAQAPWNVQLEIVKDTVGYPFNSGATNEPGSAHALMEAALQQVYGVEPVQMGCGGSIPVCTAFAQALPEADIVLFGVEEPGCMIHCPNESVDPSEIKHCAMAQAVFLRSMQ